MKKSRELERQNLALRRDLVERDSRARVLETEILELNQKRQDVAKRIDDLISQLDHHESQALGAR